jgi:DNA-binding transcriptional ArsR family regulator
MTTASNLEILHRLRDAVRRASELELADLDRQIRALERAKPIPHAQQGADREHERALLHAMQVAGTPLPPREIAQRLNTTPRTVSRWLVAARRHGYVERVDRARYQVAKEVPPM